MSSETPTMGSETPMLSEKTLYKLIIHMFGSNSNDSIYLINSNITTDELCKIIHMLSPIFIQSLAESLIETWLDFLNAHAKNNTDIIEIILNYILNNFQIDINNLEFVKTTFIDEFGDSSEYSDRIKQHINTINLKFDKLIKP